MRKLLISNHVSFLAFLLWFNYEGDVDGNNSKTSQLYCSSNGCILSHEADLWMQHLLHSFQIQLSAFLNSEHSQQVLGA
jgi:hypothetical protein